MRKIKESLSNLKIALSNASLTDWMSGLGFLIGLISIALLQAFVWTPDNDIPIALKITITVLFIAWAVLYISGTVALQKKEREERERFSSFENYELYKKFSWHNDSYAKYLTDATNYYMSDLFGRTMNNAIACSIIDFVETEGEINSLYSIKLFFLHINENWERYENREITFFCFIPPYGCLSMAPFTDSTFDCNYDNEILQLLKRTESSFLDNNEDLLFCLSLELTNRSFDNKEFDLGFYCSDSFDFYKFAGDDTPIFVKVTGELTKDKYNNSRFIIDHCQFERYNYLKYASDVRQKYENFKYNTPKYPTYR